MSDRSAPAADEEERRVLGLQPVPAPVHGRYGRGRGQVYDLWPATAPDAPLVILLHGGYWRYDRTHLTPFAAYLCRAGFTVALPEFGRAPGLPRFPAIFDDVALAIDTLPAGRSFLLAGHSSGGQLALWAAARGLLPRSSPWHTRRLPSAVLALAPVTDLAATVRDRLSNDAGLELLGDPADVAARLPLTDPVTIVGRGGDSGVPTVLLFGGDDAEVPAAQFHAYLAAHPQAEAVELPGTGHYTPIEPGSVAAARVVAALRRLATCPGAGP